MKIIKQTLHVKKTMYYDKLNVGWYINWFRNDLCHREDGPAEVWKSGAKFYYLNGQIYFKNKDKYWKKVHANY